eukprot:NODE_157_length_16664_cov_0.301781.p11 type:complete len:142 gc:universal NODE_157_length_16664_cov_0.301781:9963-9538(-)
MLNACSTVVVYILLNLRFFQPLSRFINWHFNRFIIISNYNGTQRRVLRMNLFVIHRPKSMKLQCFLIVFTSRLHLKIGLVANAMVNILQRNLRKKISDRIWVGGYKSRKKSALVIFSFHKRVNCITICLDSCNYYFAELIF